MLDKLFINGEIYSMKKEGEKFQSLGIKDGKITFLGTDEEAKNLSSKELINLKGKMMIPGMADAHLHLYAYCQNLTFVDLSKVHNINEMINLMKEKIKNVKKGDWVKGVNFDQSKWKENRFPTLEEMDSISKDNPIIIKRCCLHAVVANSKALEMASIGKNYQAGSGGIVELDKDGMPNGILREQSTKVFDDILPDPLKNIEVQKRIMQDVLNDMSSKGITTIHTYAAKIWQYNEDINIYKNFEKEGKLPLRVTVCIDELFEPEILTKEKLNNPYRKVQLGAYKIFSDGSMGSRSAALKEPYSDDPKNSGFMLFTQEELNNKILTGYEHGLQPAIHAIGDRALDMTLSAIEYTLKTTKEKGMTDEEQKKRLPFRIIHVQMIDDDLLERMKKLPLVLDIQPIFLCTDLHWIEDRIGKERLKGSFALKTMEKAGLIQTGGSDCPVETYEPLKGIYAAVTRQDMEGYPTEGFLPEERLSVYEALCMYTKNVPYATGQESVLGTLEIGKFADLTVLEKNLFKIDKKEIKDVKVEQTYVAGNCVFMIK
ncbi:amidohydrolase [Fusobacterium animalis]|uniref:Amidohydrolase n=2 Tax=Fusobacterium animalis TaxID=76859 RepID=A0A2G9FKK3_9FUSO|nr:MULTISPECIES: amidohydrolase [Fusobacterium]EFD80060.1 exoenzymes regulatory protein AepA [Fusobacterium animalis D11]MCL4580889.1 regulatory protein AepA [Fusobacterium nucleatum YWH7199]PIM88617.1 amidohydrolase [Fusobacterium animalis]PIM93666.1 amidohydrolase [Fusobacterium animalis]